jgi:hypothetical protein
MQLAPAILDKINLKVSRHKHPERLDWHKVNGKWQAKEGDKTFSLIQAEGFGLVVSEIKTASYSVGV